MERFFLFIFCFFLNFIGFSQQIKGYVVYQHHLKIENIEKFDEKPTSDSNPEITQLIKEKFANGISNSFELYFEDQISKFNKQETISPDVSSSGITISVSRGVDERVYYKDLSKKELVEVTNFFSRTFYIKDTMAFKKWNITQETKQIGAYLCIKATMVVPVTKEAMEAYERELEKSKNNTSNLLSPKEPREKLVEAWFTPEIPIGHGPSTYDGLPGLILELRIGKEVFLANKIVLQSKDLKPIEIPKRIKMMTRKEFAEMSKKKIESMQNENGIIRFQHN